MENWVDQNNDGNWVKVFETVDAGGWGSEGTAGCGGQADQIITWGGPIATFRWDSATDVDFKNLSIREINARGPAASGAVAGAFTSGGDGEQLMTTEQEEKE